MDDVGQMISPMFFLFLLKSAEHLEKGSIESLCRVALRVVGGGSGVADPRQLSESLEQLILELSTLIMVELAWVAKSRDEIIEDFVSSGLASFVLRGVCLCKPGEVVNYNQDVLVPTTTGLKVEEVDTDEFKGRA